MIYQFDKTPSGVYKGITAIAVDFLPLPFNEINIPSGEQNEHDLAELQRLQDLPDRKNVTKIDSGLIDLGEKILRLLNIHN